MQADLGGPPPLSIDPGDLTASYLYVVRYGYSDTVLHNDNQLRIFPRDGGGSGTGTGYGAEGQSVLRSQLWTLPPGRGVAFRDRFGNTVQRYRIVEHHTSLVVAAAGMVNLASESPLAGDAGLEEVKRLPEAFEFTSISPLVDPESVSGLAQEVSGGSDSLLEVVRRVVRWVHEEVLYLRGATNVTTTAAQVAEVMEGVCQDKSHLALGMLRSLGVPCRYLSGLLTGQTGETHSWLEFLHPEEGWLGADPTRGVVLPPARDYVRFGVGRDYTDVSPVSGSFLSRGESEDCAAIAEVRFSDSEFTMEYALELLEDAYVVKNG